MLYILASHFFSIICHLTFNIPQAFSVTTLALKRFLLKSRSPGSLACSLNPLINHSRHGNALSPMVSKGISLISSPKLMVLLGIFSTLQICWSREERRSKRALCTPPGAPAVK